MYISILCQAKIRGRLKHPIWERPKYFLRPREKAKEIGPDIQYADRNDMQRIYTAATKDSLMSWGRYDERANTAPIHLEVNPRKWVGDVNIDTGHKFRDNDIETICGEKYPPSLTRLHKYSNPDDNIFRDRFPDKEV
ncbi:unnamed protein product, partial [Choristocarpus tenellus]